MRLIQRLSRRLMAFRRDESGSYTVETVLVLPFLVMTCLALLTFVDAYRTQISNLRITYSIADMLSREQFPATRQTVEGLGRVYDYLTVGDENTYMRISSVIWDETNARHILVWSDVTFPDSAIYKPQPHTEATLPDLADRIPVLADGDSIIVVETWMDYTPPFDVGFGGRRFANYTVVSPRFVPVLRYEGTS
ncbi:TadE/TadG family type IV pilus assembly protein [Palleronia abyssalis]|uniref:Flp pilus assembly protein TadG n=1 Tax=Palleronia abyssalis TaxID=1501240 RepID=A0A2R8BV01_9RHOB|nr:pilus assembly protein [Palleronia abyssalis]SPJ23982.1 hypothetical protein PAA8504_01804 [Palleronia abyssalis]